MTNFAQSVTGPIARAQLGSTLMHEHILCDLRNPKLRSEAGDIAVCPPIRMENRFQVDYFQNRNQRNMMLDEDTVALAELRKFKEAGGGTVVDLTTGGLAPQPARLAELSSASGVNVVLGAGFYVEDYLPEEIRRASTEALQELIEKQLGEGAWGTPIRCGLIGEIGCNWPLTDCERRMLIAAARAQRRTGAALTIHPGRHPDAPAEIADVIVAAGGEPNRTVIGHMDRTIFDRERLLTLLHRGFVLEWDFFGIETSQYWMAGVDLDLPTDYMRIDLIHDLMGLGFSEQITVSHDICTKTRLTSYGGHGYGHLIAHVAPLALRRGWREEEIEQLLVATPARLLCFLTGPAANNHE